MPSRTDLRRRQQTVKRGRESRARQSRPNDHSSHNERRPDLTTRKRWARQGGGRATKENHRTRRRGRGRRTSEETRERRKEEIRSRRRLQLCLCSLSFSSAHLCAEPRTLKLLSVDLPFLLSSRLHASHVPLASPSSSRDFPFDDQESFPVSLLLPHLPETSPPSSAGTTSRRPRDRHSCGEEEKALRSSLARKVDPAAAGCSAHPAVPRKALHPHRPECRRSLSDDSQGTGRNT